MTESLQPGRAEKLIGRVLSDRYRIDELVAAGAMAGIYRKLLEHISASPQTALASRMSLSGREKAMIAAAALAGLGRVGKARRAAGGRA